MQGFIQNLVPSFILTFREISILSTILTTMEFAAKSFTVRHATFDDILSLTTIVPRSFHPTNPYILKVSLTSDSRIPFSIISSTPLSSHLQHETPPLTSIQLLPNTPTIRQWWTKIFTSKLHSPTTSHLLTATSSENQSHSLGVLSLQLLGPSDRGAGFWSEFPPTPDHDAAAYADVASNLTNAREALTMGQPHFVVELFGVDHETKGSGLGKKLLLKACEIADEVGLPIFVMANASARGIYQHPEIGFEVKDVKVLPGEMRYEEYMLVRPGRTLDGMS